MKTPERLRRAVAWVLRNPATSKTAKMAAGRGLTQTSESPLAAWRRGQRASNEADRAGAAIVEADRVSNGSGERS